MDQDNIDKGKLLELITKHFNLVELKKICFDLGITYEELSGNTRTERSIELIDFCERTGRLQELIEELQSDRPHVDWSVIIIVSSRKNSNPPSQHNPQPSQQDTPHETNDTDNGPPKKRTRPETHLLKVLFVNIILFVVILGLIISLRLAEHIPFTFCGSDTTIVYGLSILIVLVFHSLWHIISPALDGATAGGGEITLFGIKIPIGTAQSIIDAFHPWLLSERVFWPAIIAGIVVTSFSLIAVPINNQPVPTLIRFSISVDDGSVPARLSVGTPLELQPGQIATVEAIIGELKGANCSWESLNGELVDVAGCKITYIAPQFGNFDFLELTIASRCSQHRLSNTLLVNILDSP
jgi:hypothetical protein